MTSTTEPRTQVLEMRDYDRPARDLPFGIVAEVCELLRFHGLEPTGLDVVMALGELVRKTPLDKGGRLRADGAVDRD